MYFVCGIIIRHNQLVPIRHDSVPVVPAKLALRVIQLQVRPHYQHMGARNSTIRATNVTCGNTRYAGPRAAHVSIHVRSIVVDAGRRQLPGFEDFIVALELCGLSDDGSGDGCGSGCADRAKVEVYADWDLVNGDGSRQSEEGDEKG